MTTTPGTKIVKTNLKALSPKPKPNQKPKPENRDPFASLRSLVPPRADGPGGY